MTLLSGKPGDCSISALLKYIYLWMGPFSANSSSATLLQTTAKVIAASLFHVGTRFCRSLNVLFSITNEIPVQFYALSYAVALHTFVVVAQQLSMDIDPACKDAHPLLHHWFSL